MLSKDTSERVIPDFMKPANGLLVEHIARFHFSMHDINGRVLDLACSFGFDSQMLAKISKKLKNIVAVDYDYNTAAYARGRYNDPLAEYLCGDAVHPLLPRKLGVFDVIVSFETIEHIEDEQQFLSNVYQLLKPGGVSILSTLFDKGRRKPCGSPFHVHQLPVDEFKNLFHDFKFVQFYGQKGVLIEPQRPDTPYPIGLAVLQSNDLFINEKEVLIG